MASNIAARRAAKANRRKAVVAEKRRSELGANSLAARVATAAKLPLHDCLLTEGWAEAGMGSLIVTRGVSHANLSMGLFLIDAYCLGVKDVGFRSIGGVDLDRFVAMASQAAPLAPVDPAYARKLLREVVAWAAEYGFPPHRDFAAVERLFGSVDADACAEVFQFGHAGSPLYVPGPTETPRQIERRMGQYLQHVEASDVGPIVEGSAVALEG
jgi:hypothetical protein